MLVKIPSLDDKLQVDNVELTWEEGKRQGRLFVAYLYRHVHSSFYSGVEEEIRNLRDSGYLDAFDPPPVVTREEMHKAIINRDYE